MLSRSNKKIITLIGLISSVIGITSFLLGKSSIKDYLNEVEERKIDEKIIFIKNSNGIEVRKTKKDIETNDKIYWFTLKPTELIRKEALIGYNTPSVTIKISSNTFSRFGSSYTTASINSRDMCKKTLENKMRKYLKTLKGVSYAYDSFFKQYKLDKIVDRELINIIYLGECDCFHKDSMICNVGLLDN